MLSIRRADALLRGGQREQAKQLLASLEAGSPGFLPITALAERDALAHSDWIALARAYAGAAEAARLGTTFGPGVPHAGDPAAAAAFYVAAAEIWAHEVARGGDAAMADTEARAALGHALELSAGHPAATQALVELHERAGRVDDAAAVLEAIVRDAPTGDHDGRAAALERLARLYRDHGQPALASAAERRLYALAPDDVRLGWRVDAGLAISLDDRAARIDHLAQLAKRDPDPARRGIALETAARLAEEAGDRARATELYRATLGVWPGDRYARAAVVELLRADERWDELVSERRAEAAELPDDAAGAGRALREAAWVLEDRLGRAADAALVYRELLDRSPDDPYALLGLIRTRAAAEDRDGLINALEQRADLVAAAGAQAATTAAIELALAQERAGRLDDALDSYRRARTSAPSDPTVGAALAAAAIIDLSVARDDTAARVDAMSELARATADADFAAALFEDIGWLYALVLEDFDQAAAGFASALAKAPGQRGALLGAALVAARRGEANDLSAAIERLASAVSSEGEGAATASALHLRAAALAVAAGDNDEAAARVAAARAASADDVGALVVTAEAQAPASPPKKGTPEETAAAVDQLLSRAEVLTMRADMADDPAARTSWELDRAEALECAGRLKEAGAVVTAVLKAAPDDLRALEALRRLTRRGNDRPTWARASLALASRIGDGAAKLAFLREAAAIFDPAGQPEVAALAGLHEDRADGAPAGAYGSDPAAAVAVYKRILTEDPTAPEFTRLCTIARQHGDVRTLALAIGDRLTAIDAGGALPATDAVPLLLERARVRAAIGDVRAAAADLDDLLRRDDAHAEALRMLADQVLALGDAQRATQLWRRYLTVEQDAGRRADAELQLSKVLAENMDDVHGAIDQLERVIAASPHDAVHRERLIGLATRAQDWGRVVRELREIARLRAGRRARPRGAAPGRGAARQGRRRRRRARRARAGARARSAVARRRRGAARSGRAGRSHQAVRAGGRGSARRDRRRARARRLVRAPRDGVRLGRRRRRALARAGRARGDRPAERRAQAAPRRRSRAPGPAVAHRARRREARAAPPRRRDRHRAGSVARDHVGGDARRGHGRAEARLHQGRQGHAQAAPAGVGADRQEVRRAGRRARVARARR
jgi:hypothetical protein